MTYSAPEQIPWSLDEVLPFSSERSYAIVAHIHPKAHRTPPDEHEFVLYDEGTKAGKKMMDLPFLNKK